MTPEETYQQWVNFTCLHIYKNGLSSPIEVIENKESVFGLAMLYALKHPELKASNLAKKAKQMRKGTLDSEEREQFESELTKIAEEMLEETRKAVKEMEEIEAKKKEKEECKND